MFQNNQCAYCDINTIYNYHVEHIKPLAFGGTNKQENLVISCPDCNLVAGSRIFTNFSIKRKWILGKRNKNI